jgi:raffinose/stachyose/melibiose transport system permease protein
VVWILTEGGPAYRSELIVTYLYKFGIQRMQLGFGSALAIILFLMTLIFSIGYQRTVLRQTLAE